MAATAARAVWGENSRGEEPVSGKTGDVSKGEPYDAGNMGDENVETTTNGHTAPPTTDTNTADKTTTNGHTAPEAAETTSSSAQHGDSTAAQNDVRDPEQPETDPAKTAPRENVDDSSPGPDVDANPVKVDGPGPKPIDEVAQEHGGDAGNNKPQGQAEGPEEGEEEEQGPKKKSTGTGTGEKYVKSSGLSADGGDFDATKAGAGREADRLLEEKGMHPYDKPGESKKSSEDTHGKHSHDDSAGGKPSIKERIKAKFHKS